MVEFAFVMPLFLTLVFGIIELGRVWAAKQALTIAAREGARVLVLPYGGGLDYTSEGEVMAAAEAAVRSYMNSSSVPVAQTTKIYPVRVTPGNDNIYGTADDVYEKGYTDAKRGERVGMAIIHDFDTPIGAILGMFSSSQPGPGDPVPTSGFKMTSVAFMDHE
jgi:hypothetical protein